MLLTETSPGFSIKHKIKPLTKSGKINNNQLRILRSIALEFLVSLCTHFTTFC